MLKFLTLSNGHPDKIKANYNACLHKIYAFNDLRIKPEKVVSLNFDLMTSETIVLSDEEINVDKLIDYVKTNSSKMLELLTDHQCAFEGNFAKNADNCKKCKFQKYCKKTSKE